MRSVFLSCLLITFSLTGFAQEICDNAIDDDGNGLIDLNDLNGCPCDAVLQLPTLITNGSFEDFNCCPEGVSQSPYDYLNCATGWVDYLETATADYFNTCNYFPGSVPDPLPTGGSGAVGMGIASSPGTSYYEFIAQCLPAQMQTGQTYEFGFNVASIRRFLGTFADLTYPINYGPVDLAIYGLSTCPPMPYDLGIPANICMTDLGWTQLGQVTYVPTENWEEVSFSFAAPFDVQAIAFGPTCPTPADYTMSNQSWPYFFFDDFILEPIVLSIETEGDVCTNDLVLSATPYDASAAQYQWYFNGVAILGETGQELHASDLGLMEGIYQISAWNASDCVVAADTIEVEWPEPDLTATPFSGCAPLEVEFTNTTSTPIGSSSWDLGDGTIINATDAIHTYSDPGWYDVTLSITSPEGCVKDSLFEDLIQVSAVPTASFVADTLIGCPGLEVQFTNNSTPSTGLTYSWDLGDGTVLTDSDPLHTYASSGLYDVLLTVSTPEGCEDDTLMVDLIEILPVPEPAFNIQPPAGCIPLTVNFVNQTVDASSHTNVWDLGNGSVITSTNATGEYPLVGEYTISLTVTNSIGCSATLTYVDTVVAHGPPTVLFNALPDSGCAPLTVEFNNDTDPAMTGSCYWEFGEGSTSNSCDPTHVFLEAGTYSVSLEVTSPAGCENDTTIVDLITALPAPIADFTMGPQPTDLFSTEIEFTDGSSNDVVTWEWEFDEGTPSSANTPDTSVIFPPMESGSYPVTLIVTNHHGCMDTTTAVVVIDGVFSVYVPNTFTPDGDGINDDFLPIIRDAADRDYSLTVFDRWGQVIFSSSDLTTGWDGSVDGHEPKTDVYVWLMRVRSDVDNMMREFRGHVTVLK